MKKPKRIQKNDAPVNIKSMTLRLGLSITVTMTKTRRGAVASHSPHIAAGEAAPSASMHIPPQSNRVKAVATVAMKIIHNAIKRSSLLAMLAGSNTYRVTDAKMIENPPRHPKQMCQYVEP
jgi:hypothetical protein